MLILTSYAIKNLMKLKSFDNKNTKLFSNFFPQTKGKKMAISNVNSSFFNHLCIGKTTSSIVFQDLYIDHFMATS